MKSFLNLILVCLFVSPVFAKTGNEKSHLVKHQTTVKQSKKQSAPEKTPPTASEVVQKFYQAYMDFKKTKTNKPPQLTFSKSFRELIKKNAKLCKQRAKGDVCGFGADGDIYLDTQDTDEKFSFKT